MEYREIVSVTGLGGLYQLLSTKSDGAIVKSLADHSTKFISARLHNVTPLESIEIYTSGENVRLHEVLEKMRDSKDVLPDAKKGDNKTIQTYFKTVFSEIDDERVYVSDMKKILKWFDILKANDLLNFDVYNVQDEAPAEEVVEEKPAKKAKAEKTEEPKEEVKEKPAKKTTAKKAAAKKEEGAEEKEKPAKKTTAKKSTAKKKAE